MGISWADDPAGQTRRPAAAVKIREVLNAIFYVLSTGCQWRALPKDLPPKSAAHFYFTLWDWDGTLERIHHELHVAVREQEGREPSPNGGDHRQPECQGRSKSDSTLDPQGLDAGKKVTGRERDLLVDTLGLLLSVAVHRFQRYARTVAAFIRLAMICLMLKPFTKPTLCLMNPFVLDRHLTALAS